VTDQTSRARSGPKIAAFVTVDCDAIDAARRVYRCGAEGDISCPKGASTAGGSDEQQ
jgi:hypothetical protein